MEQVVDVFTFAMLSGFGLSHRHQPTATLKRRDRDQRREVARDDDRLAVGALQAALTQKAAVGEQKAHHD